MSALAAALWRFRALDTTYDRRIFATLVVSALYLSAWAMLKVLSGQ